MNRKLTVRLIAFIVFPISVPIAACWWGSERSGAEAKLRAVSAIEMKHLRELAARKGITLLEAQKDVAQVQWTVMPKLDVEMLPAPVMEEAPWQSRRLRYYPGAFGEA
jgi:hypothetical protein